MTIEEKAKAYDEVLEKAKGDYIAYKKVGDIAGMDALISVFHQIAESDDERIRKELLDYIKYHKEHTPETTPGEHWDRWIAYLEKQKDNKFAPRVLPCSAAWFEDGEEKQKEQKSAQTETEKQYVRTLKALVSDFIRDRNPEDVPYYQGIFDWLDGRHIEQKPAEWNDTDMKEARASLISVCIDWERGQKTTLLPIAAVRARYFLEHLTEPKPAEWSEEDEQWLESIIKDYEDSLNKDKDHAAVIKIKIDFLKSLRPQPKQEWSEDYREEDLQTRFAFYTYKDEDGILYLSNVFVEETSRNEGLGTKILAAAEKVAETLGIITIRLKVKQDSPANAWYRKHGYGYLTFEDGYDWLEKRLEYLKPKQEWSEEDVYIHEDIISRLETLIRYENPSLAKQYVEREINWLKDLPNRFNLKPNQEWSEEDKQNFYWISTTIQERHLTPEYTQQVHKILSWLKSLRPNHWKPTEEQMEALNEVIHESKISIKLKTKLMLLENDLKSL